MTTKQILIAARKRIEKPENWTQVFMARTEEGAPTGAKAKNAYCWCASGAINAETNTVADSSRAHNCLAIAMNSDGVVLFNDTHSHAEVLAAFDKAIESLS